MSLARNTLEQAKENQHIHYLKLPYVLSSEDRAIKNLKKAPLKKLLSEGDIGYGVSMEFRLYFYPREKFCSGELNTYKLPKHL